MAETVRFRFRVAQATLVVGECPDMMLENVPREGPISDLEYHKSNEC